MRTGIFVLLVILGFSLRLSAQDKLRVEKIETLTTPDQGLFFYPKLTPDGQKVLFTGPKFIGLYLLDLGKRQITMLNSDPGAGYEFQITGDGQAVVYRTSRFMHFKKYYTLKRQSLQTHTIQVLEADVRELSTPRIGPNDVLYLKTNKPVRKAIQVTLQKQTSSRQRPAVFVGDGVMRLIKDGESTTLAPLGEGMYIWPQLSPDGKRIVFTFGGDGTYVCDLQGAILAKIGYANAPVWSPDGQWIAYMVDHDNGDFFTDSEIFISSADGQRKFQVTHTPDIIEMYPNWGGKWSQLVFASNRGQIFMATLRIEQ